MLDKIKIGQYVPSTSIIHCLETRTKIIITTILLILIVVATYPFEVILMSVCIGFLVIISNIPINIYLYSLRPFSLVICLTALLQLILIKGTSLVNIGVFNISKDGLDAAASVSIRLVLILVVIRILTATTTSVSLMTGIERLLKPLNRIGFPVQELVMIMNISMRFIPLFLEETSRIQEAQVLRGISFKTGNLGQRIKSISAILIPLFRISFNRAQDIATAMEIRCYNGEKGRTYLNLTYMQRLDYISLLITIILAWFIFK